MKNLHLIGLDFATAVITLGDPHKDGRIRLISGGKIDFLGLHSK